MLSAVQVNSADVERPLVMLNFDLSYQLENNFKNVIKVVQFKLVNILNN
jgi:hypothetical protein